MPARLGGVCVKDSACLKCGADNDDSRCGLLHSTRVGALPWHEKKKKMIKLAIDQPLGGLSHA